MAHDCHINLSVCKEDTGGKTDEPSHVKVQQQFNIIEDST
jgi:hypothetical protein